MFPSILVCSLVVLLSGCASLGPRVQGETEAVSWKATDMKLELRPTGSGNRYFSGTHCEQYVGQL